MTIQHQIEFLRLAYLRGPNLWTYRPVIEAWVDIGDLEDFPSNKIPGLSERLQAWLPGLIEHHCGVGRRGGFVERLNEGTWAAHILEHVVIELQNQSGMQTGFGKAREAGPRGIYKLVVRVREEGVGRACLEAGRRLLVAAINDQPFDVAACLRELREMADRRLLGPSTAAIVDAASERRIPHLRLTDGNLVQLGYGKRQRRIWTAETDRTSAIAESISRDKDLTKSLLASCGVPVPEGQLVASPEAAWEAANDIGLPVVVKPTDGNHGRGVATNLTTQAEIELAFQAADAEGSEVMVERFIPGAEHRLLVVGGRLVAANKGEMAVIVGDGVNNVAQLVEMQINSDPRRGEEEDFPLAPIHVEREPVAMLELQRQGLTPASVPAAGREVLVIRHGNMAFDVTDEVHPEVAAAAVLAAQVVGLDIAGIDLVTSDVSRPLAETGGAIVEVNAGPSLLMHLKPAVGKARPVGKAIVDHLFPADDNGRIPLVGIGGQRQTTLIARLVAGLLNLSGRHVGLACQDGVFLDRRRLEADSGDNFDAGERLLLNRNIDAAVIESGPRTILAEGLPYDRCLVGVVTDLGSWADLADFYIDSEDRLYNVVRTQVDLVLPEGFAVLNAAEPRVAEMAELSDGAVIFYAPTAETPALVAHLAEGGRGVFFRGAEVVLAHGAELIPLPVERCLPALKPEEREALLAAIAAAWALGVPVELIPVGIERFEQERAAATAG